MQQAESGRLHVVAPGDRRDEDPADVRVDDSEGLPSPGRYIREQRKRRGFSVEQLASATKIPRTSLVMLEEDRYDELPGPVFVKGFLRCSARALGVEPEDVMELLYERERALLQARRREKPTTQLDRSVDPSASIAGLLARASSVSLVLWVLVALLGAMVLMAALSVFGTGAPGPT